MLLIYHIFAKLSYEIDHKCIDKNLTPLYLTYTLFLMFWYVFQRGDIDMKNRNIFIFF